MNEARENKAEVYSVDDLFEFCQRYEIPNSDETRKQLVEHGMELKDINAALELMACLIGINASVVGRGILLEFNAFEDSKNIAMYCPTTENQTENYTVFVKDLAKRTMEQERLGIFPVAEGNLKRGHLTKQETFLELAIHEIRHRLQNQEGFKTFIVEDALREENDTLKKYINYIKIIQEEKEKIYRDDGKTDEFINSRINNHEFDSILIENFVINEIRDGITMDDLVKIINLQPNRENE